MHLYATPYPRRFLLYTEYKWGHHSKMAILLNCSKVFLLCIPLFFPRELFYGGIVSTCFDQIYFHLGLSSGLCLVLQNFVKSREAVFVLLVDRIGEGQRCYQLHSLHKLLHNEKIVT